MNLTEKKSKKAALAKKEHNELDNLSYKVSSIESLKVYVGKFHTYSNRIKLSIGRPMFHMTDLLIPTFEAENHPAHTGLTDNQLKIKRDLYKMLW